MMQRYKMLPESETFFCIFFSNGSPVGTRYATGLDSNGLGGEEAGTGNLLTLTLKQLSSTPQG
jgi:hypothetical protein